MCGQLCRRGRIALNRDAEGLRLLPHLTPKGLAAGDFKRIVEFVLRQLQCRLNHRRVMAGHYNAIAFVDKNGTALEIFSPAVCPRGEVNGEGIQRPSSATAMRFRLRYGFSRHG